MSNENNNDRLGNDLDRLLQDAFESRPRGGGSSPSMIDVRHRARRHQRRRVGSVVGATAMLGVSGVAVLASRGGPESGIAGDEATTTWAMTTGGNMCGYTPVDVTVTTIEVLEPTTTITWLDTTLPSEAGSTTPPYPTTTLYPSGCTPSGQYRCIGNTGMDDQGFSYFEYCEPVTPGDSTFPYPTTTTFEPVAPNAVGSILVVDASGGLTGAADDMVSRFSNTGFGEVSLLPGTRTVTQTMLMPIGETSGLDIVRQLSGIDGFDTWSADMIADQLPAGTLVVVVIGQDYWTREQLDPNTPPPTSTTDAVFDPSTTTVMATTTT